MREEERGEEGAGAGPRAAQEGHGGPPLCWSAGQQAPSGRPDEAGAAAHKGPETRVQGMTTPRS